MTYVYPNTIKTYLTRKHLLFGRQSGCYSNTTSTVVRTLTVLSSTTGKINRISNHFWHRLRHEYVVNLRKTQWASKLNLLVRFNKTREIFPSVTRVLSILLTTAGTSASVERQNSKKRVSRVPCSISATSYGQWWALCSCKPANV